jgi:hypothetical protein
MSGNATQEADTGEAGDPTMPSDAASSARASAGPAGRIEGRNRMEDLQGAFVDVAKTPIDGSRFRHRAPSSLRAATRLGQDPERFIP